MGLFSSIRDRMNEEFVIGAHNVRRYEKDPESLDEILTEQQARGFGSERGLREYKRAEAAARQGTLIAYRPSAATAQERVQLRRGRSTGILERVGKGRCLRVWDCWPPVSGAVGRTRSDTNERRLQAGGGTPMTRSGGWAQNVLNTRIRRDDADASQEDFGPVRLHCACQPSPELVALILNSKVLEPTMTFEDFCEWLDKN